jgi:hypothetical protein
VVALVCVAHLTVKVLAKQMVGLIPDLDAFVGRLCVNHVEQLALLWFERLDLFVNVFIARRFAGVCFAEFANWTLLTKRLRRAKDLGVVHANSIVDPKRPFPMFHPLAGVRIVLASNERDDVDIHYARLQLEQLGVLWEFEIRRGCAHLLLRQDIPHARVTAAAAIITLSAHGLLSVVCVCFVL